MHEAVHYRRLASVAEMIEPKSHVCSIGGCMVHHQDASAVDWPTYRSGKDKDCQHGEEDLSAKEAVTSAHDCEILQRSVNRHHIITLLGSNDFNMGEINF
jgi:hypothetical protein